MTIQEELEAMSDDELDFVVAKILYPDAKGFERYGSQEKLDEVCHMILPRFSTSQDIMPIAIENNIGSAPALGGWRAWCNDSVSALSLKTPYRAICIIFILMSESKE